MSFIRGFNPVWFEVDLAALPFDDTYYLFVLQNTFPYLPAVVYHLPNGTNPWNNPIQFYANGTLPVDIFFDTGTESDPAVYRLEFRHGNSQSDPLIYLVEDYIPGQSGGTITTVATISDNQITNAQFSLINFSSPLEITAGSSQTINVAPGWFLDLTGTGNVTLTQVPLNNDPSTINPTNAPYALRITLNGTWTGNQILRQRFDDNGMLWANKTISSSITARVEGANESISAQLVDSNGTTLKEVLAPSTIDNTFTEYKGFGTLPATTNPDVPPAAWIEYQLLLPNAVDIFVTSFQLVISALETNITYIQDSIDRQQDYTFHYYRDSLLTQPKESLLTGWDFGLNPWQFTTTTSTTPSNPAGTPVKCAYTADQTIVYQQGGASQVAVGRGTAAENYAFEVKAVTATNKFAIIQYIDPSTVRDVWGYDLSSLVRAYISSPTHATNVKFKMRLIYRTSLPSTIGAAEPFASWDAANNSIPVLAAGWTYIVPDNDPVYTFGAQGQKFTFEGMTLPASSSADMTLGIVIFTLNPMVQTATADRILFERVSLCRNDFAIDGQILSYDETLRRCWFYYETSKNFGILTSSASGALMAQMKFAQTAGTISMFANAFQFNFKGAKRTTSSVTHLSATNGVVDQVTGYMFNGTTNVGTTSFSDTSWTANNVGNYAIQYLVNTNAALYDGSIAAAVGNTTTSYILFHFDNDARLGS